MTIENIKKEITNERVIKYYVLYIKLKNQL